VSVLSGVAFGGRAELVRDLIEELGGDALAEVVVLVVLTQPTSSYS
jgi:hypothetical protein